MKLSNAAMHSELIYPVLFGNPVVGNSAANGLRCPKTSDSSAPPAMRNLNFLCCRALLGQRRGAGGSRVMMNVEAATVG